MSRPASILDRAISPAEAVEMLCMQELAERCENMQGEVGEIGGRGSQHVPSSTKI